MSEATTLPLTRRSTRAMPWLSEAPTSTATSPLTVAPLSGALTETAGGWVSGAGALSTACIAAPALMRPQPKYGSRPAVPRSTAVVNSAFWIALPLSVGRADISSATVPATTGLASEVPHQAP